jgi:hypothetical protein
LSGTSSYFFSKKSLFLENENLKNQLDEISSKESDYNSILDENMAMKETLGRKDVNMDMTLGSILSKPNQSPYDTLIIDIGAKDGIVPEQRVFAVGNVPIGYIAEVYPDSSKVILYSSPGEKTEVVISLGNSPSEVINSGSISAENTIPTASTITDNSLNTNNSTSDASPALPNANLQTTIGKDTFMQIVGRGGGNFEMILPRDAVLQKGAEAVLPGIMPYTIGTVQTIISDPRDSFQIFRI